MWTEFYQNQFYIVGSVTMGIMVIACIVFIIEKIVKSLGAFCKSCVKEIINDVTTDAGKQEEKSVDN